MKIKLKECDYKQVEVGDFLITGLGELFQIVKNNNLYCLIDVRKSSVKKINSSIEKCLKNYRIERIIPSENMTLIEEGK